MMHARLTLAHALWWFGVIVLVGLIALIAYQGQNVPPLSGTVATSTPSAFDRTLSDGAITVAFPSKDFGLATTAAEVLARAYIPPCDPDFDYCLYYTGTAYAGTNFESAGLRIKKRTDLTRSEACLAAPPAGYTSMRPAAATSTAAYASSVFSPVGGAAAGHYANGALYRLYVKASSQCFEFETRIGETQFANYPAGAIKEFTAADRAAVAAELARMLDAVSVNGTAHLFPAP